MHDEKKTRVQLDFSPHAMAELNKLRERTGASTRADLVRDALTALRWMVEKRDQGYYVLALGKDGHIVEPVFSFVPFQQAAHDDSITDRLNKLLVRS
jgi:hypothetical protein